MASQNALNSAIQIASLELELAKFSGEQPFADVQARVMDLYEKLFETHLQKGGDVGAAVATVTRAFPGSTVEPATTSVGGPGETVGGGPNVVYTGGPGDTPISFGKHQGLTIAQVYDTDPTYIRNYLAEKAREPQLLNAARAFIAQVDAA